jgi:hypothetical protein
MVDPSGCRLGDRSLEVVVLARRVVSFIAVDGSTECRVKTHYHYRTIKQRKAKRLKEKTEEAIAIGAAKRSASTSSESR